MLGRLELMSTDQTKPRAPRVSPIIAKGFARLELFSSTAPQIAIALKPSIVPSRSREVKEETRRELADRSVPIMEGANPDRFFGVLGRDRTLEYPQNEQGLSIRL